MHGGISPDLMTLDDLHRVSEWSLALFTPPRAFHPGLVLTSLACSLTVSKNQAPTAFSAISFGLIQSRITATSTNPPPTCRPSRPVHCSSTITSEGAAISSLTRLHVSSWREMGYWGSSEDTRLRMLGAHANSLLTLITFTDSERWA